MRGARLLAAACAAALLAPLVLKAGDTPASGRVAVPGFYPGNRQVWEKISFQEPPFAFGRDLQGVIIPHHMADRERLAAVWRGVSLVRSPKLIVILSPDHFTEKSAWATVPGNVVYPTPFGTVEVADELCRKLAERGLARVSDAPFPPEHGVFAHTGFIGEFFPGARILPILLGWDTERCALEGIISALEELPADEVFFAASVDFSHYNPVEASVFHDMSSEKAVIAMDKERFYGLEIDSPPSLYVLASLMEDRGARRVERFLWTQLQEYYARPISDNTSHLYFAYYPGELRQARAVSLVLFPESPPAAEAMPLVPDGLLDRWPPPRADAEANGFYPYLSALRGTENRFLKGSDLYLFDLAPGMVLDKVVSGMRVTVVCLAAGDALQASDGHIRALARACDALIIVDCDPSGAARARWPGYAAAGARIIVGRGSSAPPSWRVKEGVLYVDSLGVWRGGGNSTVPASLLGVFLDDGGCRVWDFPLSFRRGVPEYRDMPEGSSLSPASAAPMARE